MLPEVSPKAVIEWAIILGNKLEILEAYYGPVIKEKRAEMMDKNPLSNTEFVFDSKLDAYMRD